MTCTSPGTRETFQFLAYAWDVTAAQRIAAGRDTLDIPVEQIAQWLPLIVIDKEHAATVDLTDPLIIVPVADAGHIAIDGWHRVWKAAHQGVETLQGVLLTHAEENEVRLCGGDKTPRRGGIPRRRTTR